jgi:hypothetical protein
MNGVLKRIHLVHNSVRSKRFYGNIYQEVRPPPQCSKNKNVELKFSVHETRYVHNKKKNGKPNNLIFWEQLNQKD